MQPHDSVNLVSSLFFDIVENPKLTTLLAVWPKQTTSLSYIQAANQKGGHYEKCPMLPKHKNSWTGPASSVVFG